MILGIALMFAMLVPMVSAQTLLEFVWSIDPSERSEFMTDYDSRVATFYCPELGTWTVGWDDDMDDDRIQTFIAIPEGNYTITWVDQTNKWDLGDASNAVILSNPFVVEVHGGEMRFTVLPYRNEEWWIQNEPVPVFHADGVDTLISIVVMCGATYLMCRRRLV